MASYESRYAIERIIMKRKQSFRSILIITFAITFSIASTDDASNSQPPAEIARYDVFETVLTASKAYANPFLDVTVTATFTAPSGAFCTLPFRVEFKIVLRH